MTKVDSKEQGAVLIVALIMLAMVTFLVVAFVGFARFERSSVSASLRRTEGTFIAGGSAAKAQQQAIKNLTKDVNGTAALPFGLLVSRREANDFVPVYRDITGDGVQDLNSTYLDLNSEINPINQTADPLYQVTDESRLLFGDPEWIGLLKDGNKPPGPGNRFIARTAYLTVPVSQALNVRYNHNNQNPANWGHDRGQGGAARSINMAAPLYHINPDTFNQFNPTNYAGAMYELGGVIGDAIHYSRPSVGYNQALGENMQGLLPVSKAAASILKTSTKNDSLYSWFRTHGGGKRPYGFYRFMETFSAAELPEEKGGFDISSIRDEVTRGFAFPDIIPEGSSPDEGHIIRFLDEHGLEDGDKVELDGLLPPHIVDPISFPLISPSLQLAQARKDLWVQLFGSGGPMQTQTPHRLIGADAVQLVITGVTQGLRLVRRANVSSPWQPVPGNLINTSNPGYWAMSPGSPSLSASDNLSLSLPFARLAGKTAWASWNANTGQWIPQLNISTPDPMEVLPLGLQNAECKLVYRHTDIPADLIPYYVKVHDRTRVSLHRSAQLDENSRVRFSGQSHIPPIASGPRSFAVAQFNYDASSGIFTSVGPLTPPPFVSGDYVRVENAGVILQPQNNSLGGVIMPNHVFQLNSVGPVGKNDFILKIVKRPNRGAQVRLVNARSLNLRLVYPFKMDGLTASVEKMAGAMLNESLDVNELAAPKQHMLGGQVLHVPDPVSPFPLQFGLGGHQEALGPWHKPDAGIPWAGAGFPGKGSFANEVERIIQVAANIGDIYSEPPLIEIRGKDVVQCLNVNSPTLLPYGASRSDGHVGAQIRYAWSKQNKAGIDFHPYRVVFEPGKPLGNNILEGTIKLSEWDSAKNQYLPRAQSVPCKVKIVTGNDNGGQWEWKLNKFVWSDGLDAVKQSGSWVGFGLGVERESGRFVKVHLDGKKVIDYESPVRVASGQARLWATRNTKAYFTKLHPAIPYQTLQAAQANGWTVSQYTAMPLNAMPTAYQGVFRRDNLNNVYLSGLQRKSKMFSEDNLMAGWYQRSAPKVIGVKDRSGVYAGRMPVLNEVSFRAAYDRKSNILKGRLAVEVDVPFSGCRMVVTDLQISGDVTADYKRSIGDPVSPDVVFTIPSVAGGMASVDLNSTGLSSVALVNWASFGTVPRISGTGAKAKSLADIRLENIQVTLKAQILDSNFRVVDFFDGTLSVPSASLGNPMGGHELFAPIWDARVAAANGYGPGKINVVLNPGANPKYWYAANDVVPAPGSKGSTWNSSIDNIRKLRKVDISWQVNDPLVNGSEKGWQSRVYAPTYYNGKSVVPNANETRIIWMPSAYGDPNIPLNITYSMLSFGRATSGKSARQYFGVNLCRRNDAYQPWGASAGGNDYTIKDPNVGANWWTFPDVSRNGLQNVGWLGQVHRGTPWQTLYLKSKKPGILNVTGFDDVSGVLTVPSHRINHKSFVQLSGKNPLSWPGGNIVTGNGYVEVVSNNEIRLWPVPNTSSWNAGQDVLSGRGPVPNTTGLKVQNLQYWKDWAGSEDTKPINDRRLLEPFYLSGGEKIRGRFSVNNQRAEMWSGVLHGVSLPVKGVLPRNRMQGAYVSAMGGSEDWIRTDKGAADIRWDQGIVAGISKIRGAGRLKRVTDILEVPELTDKSPYLPSGDELDVERIPQQILSLLKVGGRQLYKTYIVTEQLRPARRYSLSGGKPGPGVDVSSGEVLNYEITGQTSKCVVFELMRAKAWHKSHKRGHFGKYRDKNGVLQDLPKPYAKVLKEFSINLDY